jgi:hypothetical protein
MPVFPEEIVCSLFLQGSSFNGRSLLFPDGLIIPIDEAGAESCQSVVSNNAQEQVTWVHSYVSEDKQKTYCIYDGPSPEAIRQAGRRSSLPIDRITEVRVLDPYFYK